MRSRISVTFCSRSAADSACLRGVCAGGSRLCKFCMSSGTSTPARLRSRANSSLSRKIFRQSLYRVATQQFICVCQKNGAVRRSFSYSEYGLSSVSDAKGLYSAVAVKSHAPSTPDGRTWQRLASSKLSRRKSFTSPARSVSGNEAQAISNARRKRAGSPRFYVENIRILRS
jgi:hypothetical protein